MHVKNLDMLFLQEMSNKRAKTVRTQCFIIESFDIFWIVHFFYKIPDKIL